MYKKVVVPLDGSNLAEVALAHLETIAKEFSEVLLVSVTERINVQMPKQAAYEDYVPEKPKGVTPPVIGGAQGAIYASVQLGASEIPATMGKMARTAADYLQKIVDDLESRGFKVSANVIMGKPAEAILQFVQEQGADLILLSSRGKSGFSRWDIGTIAEKVLKAATVPVLLVKPAPDFKESKRKRKPFSA